MNPQVIRGNEHNDDYTVVYEYIPLSLYILFLLIWREKLDDTVQQIAYEMW